MLWDWLAFRPVLPAIRRFQEVYGLTVETVEMDQERKRSLIPGIDRLDVPIVEGEALLEAAPSQAEDHGLLAITFSQSTANEALGWAGRNDRFWFEPEWQRAHSRPMSL